MIKFTIKLYIVLALAACLVTSEAAARSGLEKAGVALPPRSGLFNANLTSVYI